MEYRSEIELLNVDCLPFMKQCQDKQFDLAIVDPPYAINIENSGTMFKKFGQTKGWDSNRPGIEYFNELKRVSKNQIVWGGNYFFDLLGQTKCVVWWDKMNGTNMMADGELAWTNFDKHSKRFEMHHFSRGYDKKIHPTQKPTKLYEWCLMHFAEPGQKILDTHLGSGSIAIACDKLGFDLVATEIDKDYFDKATKRLNQHRKQQTLF